MESSEASWHSFDPSVAVEDSEEMARLLGVQFFGNEQKLHPAAVPPSSMYWPGQETADQYYTSAPYYMQMQEHASAGAGYHSHGYYDGGVMAGDFFVAPEEQIMADPAGFMVDLNLQFDDQDDGAGTSAAACKRKFGDQNGTQSDTVTAAKKKARSTAPPVQRKGKSSAQPKKAPKGSCSRGAQEESNGEANNNNNVPSSSNYLSDEEGSLEMTSCSNMSSASKKTSSSRGDHGGGAKARAGRGAATDPQSLYARKRREKINERLKVLQHLIPNGTKVDISTMLEEAVHYIKFMQLQIKLLSSDDMWMFAPIAYNGFNVGLDLKIAPPQQ